MDLPLISIVITSYNYAHTVTSAIASALAQDYPRLEVVLMDNASTDATPEVAAKYASDPRFRYVRNAENIGMVPNHNEGIRQSRGAYILFLSADDFLMQGHVWRSYAYLQAHPETDVLYTSTYFVNEHERFIGVRQMGGQPLAPYAGGRNEFAGLLVDGCYMCFPTMLMKRELYDRFGLLDETIKAADYEIVIRWAANGVRFAYVPEPMVAVRLHANQQSSPQNYVADAGDIREFVYMVKKFAEPFGAQLQDFEQSISRHMWGRYAQAQQAGVADADGAIRATLLEADQLLSRVRTLNRAQPRAIRPTVVVLPAASRAGLMERTLRSLTAQTHMDWRAIVPESSGQSFAPLGAYLDPLGRIEFLRLNGSYAETTAINQALRVAPGNAFIVIRAGNELPPQHLERVVAACTAGAELVRSNALLQIETPGAGSVTKDVFMPPSDVRLPWSALFGPVESLAFTRAALDTCGPFNERVAAFAEWEFFLRAAHGMPLSAIDSPVVVNATAGTLDAFAQFAALPQTAGAVHGAFRTEDATVTADRATFARDLTAVLGEGGAASASAEGIERLFRIACGGTLLAAALR